MVSTVSGPIRMSLATGRLLQDLADMTGRR